MAKIYMGIDPGKKGGIALISSKGDWVTGRRMPMFEGEKRQLVDVWELKAWLAQHLGRNELAHIAIELVNSMPKQGVASTFMFGRLTGMVEALACLYAEDEVVWYSPSQWKPALGLTADKRASLLLAEEVFGASAYAWNVLANDGVAEAGLLAYYHLQKIGLLN